jgi:uncharacterized protein (TIGR04255 family)
MTDEKTAEPVFDQPPVIETVLGVQFAPVKGLSSAHVGWFWKQFLDSKWEKIAEVVPLPDEFERFGQVAPGPVRFKLEPIRFPARLQISWVNDGRMIQIQPTRFHYNWNRVGGEYPRYRSVRREFDCYFETFRRFIEEAKLGEVAPNQWELTYIDSIPQGTLWTTPADWHELLPGLFSARGSPRSVQLESFGGEWHYEIPGQLGRLHISVQLARLGDDPTPALLLQSTARGPIGKEGVASLEEGLDLGHRVAVDLFVEITSDKAHAAWGEEVVMDTLTLQRPRRFSPSSSRRVEELVGPSGLPRQASIAGCLSSRGEPEDWGASLERVSRERSRAGEIRSPIPAQLGETLIKELASALVWIGEAGHPRSCMECVFLTCAHHGSGVASAWGDVYLVQLKRTDPTEWDAGTPEERISEPWEPFVPDTDQACTVQQMAQAWKAIGQPVTEDDVPLSVDPDDYPLF